ncbi:histidine phosphatase family protein [Paenibacillus doosanensis]|uniref:Phosphoserine phosphatase 2 n=1 Tax=Paenibacillus konkukensis TaxID=2020716 RepID=A0ABY4RIR2_9BACL|nr:MULTISPECIES: histidine phosphatase family protein [Paenibacillus]MCS7462488.1 histidine phosphatase family protein [Paenibacillus doosanensis]UQZ81905.1 Putative phosphoserine phosphatase 2 [Paenibacillus konkukensis]
MLTIGFIRHGTTEWNLAGRMQGQMDTELAEVGVRQAELLALRLKSDSWDGVIASDLIRARQTAEMISNVTGTPFIGVDARLRERYFGQVEGTTQEERIARWGEGWRELELGMEKDEELLKRWDAFLRELSAAQPGKRILLVSHGGYIAPVLHSLTGRPVESHLHNTSLTIMEAVDSGWHCRLLNCTAHLEPVI